MSGRKAKQQEKEKPQEKVVEETTTTSTEVQQEEAQQEESTLPITKLEVSQRSLLCVNFFLSLQFFSGKWNHGGRH